MPLMSTMDARPPDDAAPAVPDSPFCRELRSKKFFMLDTFATEAEQYVDASNHCWCYTTQQVIGPDGGPVSPQSCMPGRKCYISALAEPVSVDL